MTCKCKEGFNNWSKIKTTLIRVNGVLLSCVLHWEVIFSRTAPEQYWPISSILLNKTLLQWATISVIQNTENLKIKHIKTHTHTHTHTYKPTQSYTSVIGSDLPFRNATNATFHGSILALHQLVFTQHHYPKHVYKLISSEWCLSISPENMRKPLVFLFFHGV